MAVIEARERSTKIEQRERASHAPLSMTVPASDTSRHAALLAAVDLFHGLERLALAKLAANLDPVHLGAGAVACTQGEPGDGLYLVSQGTLGVYVASPAGDPGHADSTGGETRVATLGQGACF